MNLFRSSRKMDKMFRKGRFWSCIFVLLLIFLGIELTMHPISFIVSSTDADNEINDLMSLVRSINVHTGENEAVIQKSSCPDVGTGMMRGRWKTRPLTSKEETEIETFYEIARSQHGLPKSMQRNDGRCGDLSYENLYWFRAVCNPKGSTPCCHHGRCVSKSPDECQCPECYDLRIPIHAEYSTWEPEDPRCGVKNYTTSAACGLLQGVRLILVGDSLMRQLYTALRLILTGNIEDGAYHSSMPRDIHDRCRGMFVFTEKVCRIYINKKSNLCQDSVSLSMMEYYHLVDTSKFHELIKTLLNVTNTVLLVGIGYHDSFDYERVYNEFIRPAIVLRNKANAVWPRLIWATNHKFGILKTPHRPQQDNNHIQTFNKFMTEHLRQHKVPIFDTYNMTSGVMSQDGSHYGLGLNIMKSQMFLNYLHELRYNEQW